MKKYIYATKEEMATAAATAAAQAIRSAIRKKDQANIILPSGASQIEMLRHLVASEGINWFKVVMFHLDEYLEFGPDHPASFRKYLQERVVDKVGPLRATYFIQGEAEDPYAECRRVGAIIQNHPIDVACIGIGENGHIAFNDPPADFETQEPFLVVPLDERDRRQQFGEGWFETFEQVPTRAISMSVPQILKSKQLIVTVPDSRKAEAVKNALEGPVTPQCPSSILRRHKNCLLFLDEPAAALLSSKR
jgi:glucosamine-6-phosphate deaminase